MVKEGIFPLATVLWVAGTAQAYELGISRDLADGAQAHITLDDSTRNHQWRPESGRSLVTEVWAKGWPDWGGPWRWSLQRRSVQHLGVIGRYRCVIMCGWMSNRSLDPNAPSDEFNYRVDTLSLARPDALKLAWGALSVGVQPRVSVNWFEGQQTGDDQRLTLNAWPTLGADLVFTWALNAHHRLSWSQGVDGVRASDVELSARQRRLQWATDLTETWQLALAWRQTNKRLLYRDGKDSLRMDERARGWSLAVVRHW